MYSGSVHVIVIMVYVFFSANASAGCGVIHTGHHLSDMTLRQCRPPMHEAATELESFFSDKLLHPTCTKKHYRKPFVRAAVSFYNHQCSISVYIPAVICKVLSIFCK
ncbi:hypothetical protein AMECASPLE_017423 [Ameca splendens]|uniref:Secreted protein n=1 Tax=Ameca splendens TaxID=208324 RepID=A0ABV0YDJ1_9TELE